MDMADPELSARIQERETPNQEEESEGFESDGCDADDSDEDPTFDVLEETQSRFSKISLKKSRARKVSEMDLESDDGEDSCGVEVPELDEKDGKCFEKVEEMIKDGHLEKLKLEQCKVYLRKYGLRLSGNKSILIERIKEHLEVMNGGGQRKYPISSFVFNCKGDACTGDVVMFEQKVYEMFNIASRSATGPPCGTRVVAGRIVKESYGAAKQQHTFTIEVLWCAGEKPLPPLHPLLIKGRNLYRLQTMRQRWTDEEQRRRVLQEKHSRGFVARCSRDTRIKEKEMRKIGSTKSCRKKSNSSKQQAMPIQTKVVQKQETLNQQQLHHPEKQNNIVIQQVNPIQAAAIQRPELQHQQQFHQQQQMAAKVVPQPIQNYQHLRNNPIQSSTLQHTIQHQQHFQHVQNGNTLKPEDKYCGYSQPMTAGQDKYCGYSQPMTAGHHNRAAQIPNYKADSGILGQYQPQMNQHNFHYRHPLSSSNPRVWNPTTEQNWAQPRRPCPYYLQGRCYYGENCKYLHE